MMIVVPDSVRVSACNVRTKDPTPVGEVDG